MYEMPHDALDIVLSKKFGKQVEVKLNAKDVTGRMLCLNNFPGLKTRMDRSWKGNKPQSVLHRGDPLP